MDATSEQKNKLFDQFRKSHGDTVVGVEITDDQLCVALELAIEKYGQYIQEWLIENQWMSLFGKDISTLDMTFALTTRSYDYVTQFTYAYSKQVGLQQRGPWELKKDYVTLEAGKQVYEIPAGREINEVLWLTPPTTDHALMSYGGGFDYGFTGFSTGFGLQGGGGYGMGGRGGHYIAPAFDVLMAAQDINLKNRLIRSDLTYKVTAGDNGTRLLHLMSTPGSRLSFGNNFGGGGGASRSLNIQGCHVWYHYYDVSQGNADECKKVNKDIIKLPNEVPLDKLEYSDLNEPSKIIVKDVFFARAKRILSRNWGKFGGIVGPPNAERTLDYESLREEGKEEEKSALERLDERLKRMNTTEQLKRAAEEAESLNKKLKYNPLGFYLK